MVPQKDGDVEEVITKAIGLRKTTGRSQLYRRTLPMVSDHILSNMTLKWPQDTLIWLTLMPWGARARWRELRQLHADDF